jgi:hypothetical protein
MNNSDYIWSTTDISQVAYLTRIGGYNIKDIHYKTNEKNGRTIIEFVFYDSHNLIQTSLCDYCNGDISKFNEGKDTLLSLVRQTNRLTKEEFLQRANGENHSL